MNYFIVVIFGLLAYMIMYMYSGSSNFYERESGDYNASSSQSLASKTKNPYQPQYPYNEDDSLKENCNTAAIRVCQAVNEEMRIKFLSGDSGCSDFKNPVTLWSFLGSPGTTGSLDTLYTAPQNNTLDCSHPEQYGRYLFSQALPENFVYGKNISYNLIGMQTNVVDPCGFSEIIK